ncbi:MFS transporter [Sphingobium sp. JS3065]|uniref:spinster family MFS transporter n=1 Tax=Sphingobium sp. JS3065 TaxID=2970925 RepID=UPI002263DA1E|nr:MFS transporter [Sphingobium sp. JS3065]UZW56420.1 MFS transporter [Sphingobium sp. JS3065]
MTESAVASGSRSATAGVAVLLLAYVFNFVDRQIISVLAMPIKTDLGLDDQQLGLMGGVAFAIFYTTTAIPIAWLADRKSRVNIIAVSITLWSLFTAACGTVQSFWQLFFARMGVGVGEAGGVAPSYALIADLFPRERRASAMALFSLGVPVGSALGVFFGGWIAGNLDWRAAFVIVGLAGLPVALLVKCTLKEPSRGRFDDSPATALDPAASPSVSEVTLRLRKTPAFWLLSLGAACASALSYGLMFWMPSFFARTYGLGIGSVSLYYGTVLLIGGVLGILAGGWIGDRLAKAHTGSFALVPAIGLALAIPTIAAALFAKAPMLSWLLFTFGQMLASAWFGPVTAGIQQIVPANMRAIASSVYLFILNLIGMGVGIYVLGFMSDWMTQEYETAALQFSILYGLAFYVLSVVAFLMAARLLSREKTYRCAKAEPQPVVPFDSQTH